MAQAATKLAHLIWNLLILGDRVRGLRRRAFADELGDRGARHGELHAVREADLEVVVALEAGDGAVKAAGGEDLVAGLDGPEHVLMLLLLLLLRPDQEHVEDQEDRGDGDEADDRVRLRLHVLSGRWS